jgi:hypothetical protein
MTISVGKVDKERFWSKVNIKGPDDCWEWMAYKTQKGYGQFEYEYLGKAAHRFSWYLIYGDIPDGKQILHKCDNRGCVNPNHLYAGTPGDNITDREKRNPVDRSLCGVTHTKLSADEILSLRKMRGQFPSRIVAKMFNISFGTVCDIWNREQSLCKEGYYV